MEAVDIPETHYARAGKLRIAFQEFGDGPRVIIIPPLVTNIDVVWDHEFYRRMLGHMSRFMRVIHFDKRGIGLSDRFDATPTLDERIDDIGAILDTAGWKTASVWGVSEGATMAQHFAVRHPERVERLVLSSGTAPPAYADRVERLSGDAFRPLEDCMADFMQIAATWGEDPEPFVRLMAPSELDNEPFVRWANRLNRLAASPADFVRQLQSVASLSEGLAPEKISAPTLIVHTTGDRVAPIGHARVLAELIPGAKLVEVDGADHFLVSLDNWRDAFDPTIEFITGVVPPSAVQRRFATVVFTDIVSSTSLASSLGDTEWRDLIDRHDRIAHRVTAQSSGRVVKSTGDGLLAVFDAPSLALDAVTRMRAELADVGLMIRAGIHAGEIEVHADQDISGLAVNLAARVEQAAADGSIFVSSTMKDMLLGSGTKLEDRGQHSLKGIEGSWRLYEVTATAETL